MRVLLFVFKQILSEPPSYAATVGANTATKALPMLGGVRYHQRKGVGKESVDTIFSVCRIILFVLIGESPRTGGRADGIHLAKERRNEDRDCPAILVSRGKRCARHLRA